MLSKWLMPKIEENSDKFVLIQNGVLPHWYNQVRNYQDEHLPRQWVGHVTGENMAFMC